MTTASPSPLPLLAAAARVDPVEPFEHPRSLCGVDPGPLVLHGQQNRLVALRGGDGHGLVRAAVFDGVVNQVDERLLQQVAVALEHKPRLDVAPQGDMRGRGPGLADFAGAVD